MKVLAQPRQHHKLYFDTKKDCLTLKTRKYNLTEILVQLQCHQDEKPQYKWLFRQNKRCVTM